MQPETRSHGRSDRAGAAPEKRGRGHGTGDAVVHEHPRTAVMARRRRHREPLKQVERAARGAGPSEAPSRHRRIQPISFDICTKPVETPSLDHVYGGEWNLEDDWKYRVQVFKDTITQAQLLSAVESSEDCLKVFMLPEFFFRGPQGAYPMEIALAVTEALREHVNKPEFKDWLFVFGTTVATSQRPDGKAEVYNYAVVQPGHAQDASQTRIVMKEKGSVHDFLSPHAKPASRHDALDLLDADMIRDMPWAEGGAGRGAEAEL